MNFYKITNGKETHHGMKYKAGLNTDVMPFNPSGDCESGGIYFAREDILAFLHYGCWIREVTIPDGESVYENPGSPKKWKAHRVILGKRRKITAEVIGELVAEGADLNCCDGSPLANACYYGHLDIAKMLVEHGADVNVNNGSPLRDACRNGKLELAKVLVEHGADVNVNDGSPLVNACYYGHLDVAKVLVEHGADVNANNGYPLRYACYYGCMELAKWLVENGADVKLAASQYTCDCDDCRSKKAAILALRK